MRLARLRAEYLNMPPHRPVVTCLSCQFGWHSATMAEGLRLLGACPRCGGRLDFDEHAAADLADVPAPERQVDHGRDSLGLPHFVLGLPRR